MPSRSSQFAGHRTTPASGFAALRQTQDTAKTGASSTAQAGEDMPANPGTSATPPARDGSWRVATPPPAGFHLDLDEIRGAGLAKGEAARAGRDSASKDHPRLPGHIAPGWLPSRLLFNRGIRTAPAARDFLNPALDRLEDPFGLPDMQNAALTLWQACRDGQKVGICGDFDVDGLSGTAIIVAAVRALGGRPVPYIPHREQDGHGVSMAAVRALCEAGVKLMVTVDTGSTDVAEIAAARAGGMATIITDHHLPGPGGAGAWPDAVAIVNPHRAGGAGTLRPGLVQDQADGKTTSFDSSRTAPPLSGAGVALKLAQAACSLAQVTVPEEALALAALGTIADSVPLRGDNRVIVRFGLEALGKTRHAGLRALLDHSRAQASAGRPDTELVSFQLAPRLNSAGRLGDAGPSLRLLTTADAVEADALASRLDALNQERRRLSEAAWDEARGQLQVMDASAPVIVVRCDSVPPGLLGPLAGRLCELHGRPAIAVGAFTGPQASAADRAVKASARSTPGFDIHAAVAAQSGLLERFGGHARAAGFTVQEGNLAAVLEGIRRQAAWSALGAPARPEVEADCDARLEELGVSLWDFVEAMAPFGEGNPAPLLISRRVQPLQVRTMGATGRHLRVTLEENGRTFDAVGFGLGGAPLGSGTVDIAYGLRTAIWQGRVRRELDLKAVRPSAG